MLMNMSNNYRLNASLMNKDNETPVQVALNNGHYICARLLGRRSSIRQQITEDFQKKLSLMKQKGSVINREKNVKSSDNKNDRTRELKGSDVSCGRLASLRGTGKDHRKKRVVNTSFNLSSSIFISNEHLDISISPDISMQRTEWRNNAVVPSSLYGQNGIMTYQKVSSNSFDDSLGL